MHILFRGAPNTEISKFINAYKSASSQIIKKEYPQIRKSLGRKCFSCIDSVLYLQEVQS